ncbi:hypothetical protein QAD02_001960 [Eretmocerus hayati]|uniref:Uncharacterized protein n=1 Tax=Eretmocerus hayati TaxID=131215 RepID=A0ACC2NHX5_9HYME|nr:hypothetical protein QAD02_001960 [Eretmocerus hayati]
MSDFHHKYEVYEFVIKYYRKNAAILLSKNTSKKMKEEYNLVLKTTLNRELGKSFGGNEVLQLWQELRKLVANCSYKLIKGGARKPTRDEKWAYNRCQFLLDYIDHKDVLMIKYDDWATDQYMDLNSVLKSNSSQIIRVSGHDYCFLVGIAGGLTHILVGFDVVIVPEFMNESCRLHPIHPIHSTLETVDQLHSSLLGPKQK